MKEVYSYYFAPERLLILISLDLLEGVYFTSLQLTRMCSKCILFVSQEGHV